MRASGGMPFTMSRTEVLTYELTLTSREIACIDFLGRVLQTVLAPVLKFHSHGVTHDSIDGGTDVLLLNSSCHSLGVDMENSSRALSYFSFVFAACHYHFRLHPPSLPHCHPPLWLWSFCLCPAFFLLRLRDQVVRRQIGRTGDFDKNSRFSQSLQDS